MNKTFAHVFLSCATACLNLIDSKYAEKNNEKLITIKIYIFI